MALSHLLQRRSSLFVRRNAFQRRERRLSSQSSSDTKSEKRSNLKKTNMAKEQRAEAVESFVKKYMERNPGVFPKATLIRNEVGGSWYTVKETLESIKRKMLGERQPEIDHGLIDSISALAPTGSDSNLSDQPDSGALTDLGVIPQSMDENIRHTEINAQAESSSDMVVDAEASEATNVHDSSGSCELQAASVLSANSAKEVSGREKDASANIIPLVDRSQSEGAMQLNAVSDGSELELENGRMLQKVHSNICESSEGYPLLNSAELPDLEHGKVNSTGYRTQQENKELTCSLFLNLCSDMTDKSALNGRSVSGLADLFRNSRDNEAIAESKNRQLLEGLQSGTFGFERERNPQVNQLSSSYFFSSSESPNNMQVTGLNQPVFAEYENHPPEEEMTISSGARNIISKVEPFATAKKTGSLEDANTSNQAQKVIDRKKSDMVMHSYIEHLEEYKEKDGSKNFEIKHLIDCIRKLPQRSTTKSQESTPTCERDGSSNGSQSGETELLANFQGFGKKGKKPSEKTAVPAELEDDGPINILSADLNVETDAESSPEIAVPDLVKSLLTNKKESNEIKDKFFLSKESDQNKAMVKFLGTVTETDVYNLFQNCGDISKVEISNVEGAFYQVAYVYFRTREGLRRALEKTDVCVKNSQVAVEAVDLNEDVANRISIPSLIGDPNIPAELVKDPRRTVMIGKLTHNISSHHIDAALTFCGSKITGFFLGSSNSVAYVEFETEDGKETALAKGSIHVLGKQLLISRIDIPRTTVVRISHHQSIKTGDIVKVCKNVGKLRAVRCRLSGVVDVQFTVAEWPNMLNILNRLNEFQVAGRRLLAQPATVIPPEILRVLWRQPEERKYIKSMLQKLSQRVGGNVPICSDLESFYREKL